MLDRLRLLLAALLVAAVAAVGLTPPASAAPAQWAGSSTCGWISSPAVLIDAAYLNGEIGCGLDGSNFVMLTYGPYGSGSGNLEIVPTGTAPDGSWRGSNVRVNFPATPTTYDLYYNGAPMGQYAAPAAGGTVPAPSAPVQPGSTCSSFGKYWTLGTVGQTPGQVLFDLHFKWVGTAPAKGWSAYALPADAADVAPTAPPLFNIPAVKDDDGFYGVTEETLSGVSDLRILPRLGPYTCYLQLALTADGGVLPGATGGGDAYDPNDPDGDGIPGTGPDADGDGLGDGDGSPDCSHFDLPCWFQYLFIPSPSSWDVGAVVEQAKTRPPISVVLQVTDAVQSMANVYTNDSQCSGSDGSSPGSIEAAFRTLSCPGQSNLGITLTKSILAAALVFGTALYVWRMIAASMGGGGS
jgi:hypothetical protein